MIQSLPLSRPMRLGSITAHPARFMLLKLLMVLGVVGAPVGQAQAQDEDAPRWFRGQLHAHSFWSDGRGFPEQAALLHREQGYHFLSLTEHNLFADKADHWRVVEPEEGSWPPRIAPPMLDVYMQKVGRENVELKTDETRTMVRLKSFAEVKARYEVPGEFIMMPGVEVTLRHNDHDLHMNYINVPAILPSLQGVQMVHNTKGPGTISELISRYTAEIERVATEHKSPHIVIVNHPFWRYYDVPPQALIDNPAIRVFEVCNDGIEHAPHPEVPGYSIEKFWDIVNAFRAFKGLPLLYGAGTGDTHYYDDVRHKKYGDLDDGWVMVRARRLTPEDLLSAMLQGDFYASNGVLLQDVSFTPQERTLRVQVQAEPGVNYRIHFVTTKRGFDQAAVQKTLEKEGRRRPARTVTLYSDDIGQTVKTVEGTQGEYRLADDDLYVRARVESDQPSVLKQHFYPLVKMAWTQPYAAAPAAAE